MKKNATASISLVCLLLFLMTGCSSTFELQEIAYSTNVEKPFVNERSFAYPADQVYQMFLDVLAKENVVITGTDPGNRFVCWSATASDFRKLMFQLPENSWYPIDRGIVHGSARVWPDSNGAVISLHCTFRDNINANISYSNGNYERNLLNKTTNKLKTNY